MDRQQRFCRQCGDPVRDPEDRFCGHCGRPYDYDAIPGVVDATAPTQLGSSHLATHVPPTRAIPAEELAPPLGASTGREPSQPVPLVNPRPPPAPVPVVRERPPSLSPGASAAMRGMAKERSDAGASPVSPSGPSASAAPPARRSADPRSRAPGTGSTQSAWDIAEISADDIPQLPRRRLGGCLLKTLLVIVVLAAVGGTVAWFVFPENVRPLLDRVGIRLAV